MRSLTLTKEQSQNMLDHAAEHAPLEACGLLAGKNSKVERVIEIRNQAESPVRYLMDPLEQLDGFEWIESNGMELLGIFHSHPCGPENVSPSDVAESAYAVVHIILACVDQAWSTHGYWIEDGLVEQVRLIIE